MLQYLPMIASMASTLLNKQKAPNIPDPEDLDLGGAVSSSISINNANLGRATELTSKVNTAAQAEASRLMELAMPGYSALRDKLTASVSADLDGQYKMPKEMESEIARLAAERGISRGTSGGFNDFSLIRDFGFNLTDYAQAKRQQALATLSSLLGMTPRVNPMSPTAFLVSPQQALGVQQENIQNRYQASLARSGATTKAANYNQSMMASIPMILAQAYGGGGGDSKSSDGKGTIASIFDHYLGGNNRSS